MRRPRPPRGCQAIGGERKRERKAHSNLFVSFFVDIQTVLFISESHRKVSHNYAFLASIIIIIIIIIIIDLHTGTVGKTVAM
jgi:hypothetical protein